MSYINDIKKQQTVLREYGEVTTGRFAQFLVAAHLDGQIENAIGFDVRLADGSRVEVRSRMAGSDSEAPRVTLTPTKMAHSTKVAAVRFARDYSVLEAKLVTTVELADSYAEYLQHKDGRPIRAHVPSDRFFGHRSAICITASIQEIARRAMTT